MTCVDMEVVVRMGVGIKGAKSAWFSLDDTERNRGSQTSLHAILRNAKVNPAEDPRVGSPVSFRREQTRGVVKWRGL